MATAICLAVFAAVLAYNERGQSKFQVGDHIMPIGSSDLESILKIVGVAPNSYKVFPHLLVDGKLIVSEDYAEKPRSTVDKTYVKIPAPETSGSFSAEKFISEANAITLSSTGSSAPKPMAATPGPLHPGAHIIGKVYRDGRGRTATYLGNGRWKTSRGEIVIGEEKGDAIQTDTDTHPKP